MGRVQGAHVISLPSAAVDDLCQLLNATQSLPTLVDRNIVANRYNLDVRKVTKWLYNARARQKQQRARAESVLPSDDGQENFNGGQDNAVVIGRRRNNVYLNHDELIQSSNSFIASNNDLACCAAQSTGKKTRRVNGGCLSTCSRSHQLED
eukprot:COSAG01_NODE_5525_length_4205_cov_68.353629_6_plen_151_part_00